MSGRPPKEHPQERQQGIRNNIAKGNMMDVKPPLATQRQPKYSRHLTKTPVTKNRKPREPDFATKLHPENLSLTGRPQKNKI